MKVSIDEINKASLDGLEINFSDYIEDLDTKDKISAVLTAKSFDNKITINGKIKTSVILQCDRCLNDFVFNIDVDIEEKFITNSRSVQKETEIAEFAEIIDNQKEIDVNDLIYQAIILEIPYKKLCDENCPGTKEFQDSICKNNDDYIDERLEVFKSFSDNIFDEKK